jgi:SWIM zinc finger
MSTWTHERVIALAPDAASASAGQALASSKKWVSIASSERALWGLCQGSGKSPYQTRIDLSEPAFKCGCPSRKFPCKHALGLMILYSKDAKAFKPQSEPTWVSDWLGERTRRSEKQAERAKATPEKPADSDAQAGRAAKRDERVRQGVHECRVWLEDLVRRGLAAARNDTSAEWERVSARMVDAQAPGLATLIRRIASSIASGEGWEVRTLGVIGRLHLLLEAAVKLGKLPADLALDVRTMLGYPQSKDDVLSSTGIQDAWAVIGQIHEDEDRLTVRRTWLYGRASARRALIVGFAGGGQRLDAGFIPGTEFEGELAFYPSRAPLRALAKARGEARPIVGRLTGDGTGRVVDNLRAHAEALSRNPWLACWPMVIENAKLSRQGDRWWLVDREGLALPLRPGFCVGSQLWRLLAVGGGRGITTIAEWDGEWAQPVAALAPGGMCDLAPRWVA